MMPTEAASISSNSPTWVRVSILIVSFSLLSVFTVLCGSIINSDGLKYSTVRPSIAKDYLQNHGLTSYDPILVHAGTNSISTGNDGCVVALSIPNSLLCCGDVTRNYEWICTAAFDPMNKLFTKSIARAILFPLLPVIFSGAGDVMASASHQQTQAAKSMATRLLLYFGIIVFRMVGIISLVFSYVLSITYGIRCCVYQFVLYLIPLWFLSHSGRSADGQQCWCPDLVSSTK
jgi:hypothetical protein